jgi:hypothetical protein
MHQADLAESIEFPGGLFVAVGWLDAGSEYATGSPSEAVYRRLLEFCTRPWQAPVPVEAGVHACNLCLFDGPQFNGRLFVPGRQVVYVCPTGITHYIAAHRYAPPVEFQQAVLEFPSMQSREYLHALSRLRVLSHLRGIP